MKPRPKRLFLEALRSGKYSQGKGALRTPDGYCCLGVLCDVYAQEVGGKWQHEQLTPQQEKEEWFTFRTGEDDLGEEVLPLSVRDWAGLNTINPCIACDEGDYKLSVLNDQKDYTFAEIADLVEEHL